MEAAPKTLTTSFDDDGKPVWLKRAELVIERKSGKVRQAGASQAEGKFIGQFKLACERSLYAFLDGVMNYGTFLEPALHKPVCDWLTTTPPYRKLLLMPRNHGKSTLVGRGIPLHALIQPKASNIYFPGEPGVHLRLVMAGETEERAKEHMRVLKSNLENNVLLRALWPHVCWDNPRRQAPAWSDTAIIVPRETEYAEVTIRAIGQGGAITGSHPNMLIKDDITTERAANEPPTMQKAIEWHLDSRALFEDPEKNLEFITATRWAAYDLPGFVQENDPTVEVNTKWRRVVDPDTNKVIYPFKYGYDGAVEQLMKEHGVKFPLLFLNEVAGSDLTDFLLSDVREYELKNGVIRFADDYRDDELGKSMNNQKEADPPRGMDLYTALSLSNLDYMRNTRSL